MSSNEEMYDALSAALGAQVNNSHQDGASAIRTLMCQRDDALRKLARSEMLRSQAEHKCEAIRTDWLKDLRALHLVSSERSRLKLVIRDAVDASHQGGQGDAIQAMLAVLEDHYE